MKMIQKDRCLVFVPDGAGPHPVLCFLHGAGEAAVGGNGKPQTLATLMANGSPAWHAEKGSPFVAPFLLVCPQLESRRRWEQTDAPWVDSMVQESVRDHGGDLARLMLTGFSYGGEGAFQIAAASGLKWPTIWAVDPALQRIPPLPAPHVRVWVHHGTAQPGAESMNAFAAAMALAPWRGDYSSTRSLTVLPTNHPGTCAAAYAEAGMYQWLLQ